jgi:hypothetical protein
MPLPRVNGIHDSRGHEVALGPREPRARTPTQRRHTAGEGPSEVAAAVVVVGGGVGEAVGPDVAGTGLS